MLEHFYFRLVYEDLEKKYIQCRSIHIMAAILMLIYALLFIENYEENWMQIVMLSPPALVIMFLAIFKKRLITDSQNNRIFRILESGILIMASLRYLQSNQYPPAIFFGLFALFLLYILFMEHRLFSPQFIDVTAFGVSIALPTHNKKIEWFDIKNIVVKGQYFTLETTTKKVWQYKIANSLTADEFSQFLTYISRRISD